ncbi:MAG: hypothetical protein RBR86_07285 [Pseudobdellovibrionaceae bacterium]|jgi:hypothetical protein|nr:hypothetical protein [Pseudobdellovibrionaceae bacterium]
MPQNGYWIECVPIKLAADTLELTRELHHNGKHIALNASDGQYRAVFSSIPELDVVAQSPDVAIDMLRQKLRALSRYYRMTGRSFPERDNPVHPPKNLRSVQGWISVYVQFSEKCGNC